MKEERTYLRNALNAHAVSHIGGRERNEDFALIHGSLFVVSDGVSGDAKGEKGSQRASRRVMKEFLRLQKGRKPQASLNLYGAVFRANRHLAELRKKGKAGAAAIVAAFVEPETSKLHVMNLGDSKAFLLRRGGILQLTRDHTFAEELFEKGHLDSPEDAGPKQQSQLTRYAGDGRSAPEPVHLTMRRGDRLLLCSDGMDSLPSLEIFSILKGASAPKEAAEDLVKAANQSWRKAVEIAEKHGRSTDHDNVTALVYFHEPHEPPRPAKK